MGEYQDMSFKAKDLTIPKLTGKQRDQILSHPVVAAKFEADSRIQGELKAKGSTKRIRDLACADLAQTLDTAKETLAAEEAIRAMYVNNEVITDMAKYNESSIKIRDLRAVVSAALTSLNLGRKPFQKVMGQKNKNAQALAHYSGKLTTAVMGEAVEVFGTDERTALMRVAFDADKAAMKSLNEVADNPAEVMKNMNPAFPAELQAYVDILTAPEEAPIDQS